MTSKITSGNAVKIISSEPGASTEDMNVIVKQLASKAKLSSSVHVSGDSPALKGGKIDVESIKNTIAESGEFIPIWCNRLAPSGYFLLQVSKDIHIRYFFSFRTDRQW